LSHSAHVLRRAARSIWENLYLHSVSVGVIASALLLVGVFLSVQFNLNRMVTDWTRDVHVSAYFLPDVPEQRRFAIRERLAKDPRVAKVVYVSEEEAQDWLIARVEGVSTALAELGPGVLPASVEITLVDGAVAAPNSFVDLLPADEFSDVDMGQDWVARFNEFLRTLQLLGALLGVIITATALFVVSNTVNLVIYSRRDEVEIEKLVGASTSFIIAPFLIEGAIQGVAGGVLAVGGLWSVHAVLVHRLQNSIQIGVANEMVFLPPTWIGLLVAAGLVLGLGASTLSVTRFLSRAA
jgi:cell division transport system permease protein